MKNALLYSPGLAGHRQVYIFVLANILRKLAYSVYIAANFAEKPKNSFYLDKLETDPEIFWIDTNRMDGNGVSVNINDFKAIQKSNDIILTIFLEADNHIALFNSQVLNRHNRLLGKNMGIFLRPFYFYKNFNLLKERWYVNKLRSIWKTDSRIFHEILNPAFGLLDKSFCIDEYFTENHKKTVWLPDMFQQFADRLVLEENFAQRKWIEKLNHFKKLNEGRLNLLYFGAPQDRRGYRELLQLALRHDACFIHCGLLNTFSEANDEKRALLQKENRLFETNEYITDPFCIASFFKSVSHIVLPYINFLGSSGVMLQALSYNIPVLVPEHGIIGYRVNKHNLGLTYTPETFDAQFQRFFNTPADTFSESINKYMRFQSADQLESILMKVLAS